MSQGFPEKKWDIQRNQPHWLPCYMPNELPWKLEAELVETPGLSDRNPSSKELKQKGNGLAQVLESCSYSASGTAESRALLCYNQDCLWQL